MGRFKVYLKPFEEDGQYQDDWVDVTEDVDFSGIGVIKQSLDNTEYDIGVFRNNTVALTLINNNGRYSETLSPNTVFKFRRSNSMVRITWEIMHHDTKCGFFKCGRTKVSEPVTVFEGLLNDDAIKQNAGEQNLSFQVLGKERILSETLVDIDALSNGDLFSNIIFNILNQTQITNLLTVSALNITCDTDIAADDVSGLENKTVIEALKSILLYSNSVLYIRNDIIYVSPRDPSADLEYTFYGQGDTGGRENIIDLIDYRSGQNRTFNFITWTGTTLLSQDNSSVDAYGIRKKEIQTDLITNTSSRQSILNNIKTEFSTPKVEFILRAAMDYDTVALGLLDKVSVDYPNIGIPDSGTKPLWDQAVWDVDKFPIEILPISIDAVTRFKILSRDIDTANQEIVLYLREV